MNPVDGKPTLGEALRDAFLAGEQVVAGRFADLHGFTRQGVASALRTLEKRELVHGEHVARESGGGTPLLVYTCINRAGLLARTPMRQEFNPMVSIAAPEPDFTALELVWGIQHADLHLPGVRHCIDTGMESA